MNLIEKLKLLYHLNKLYGQLKGVRNMTDAKTTAGGIIITISFILKLLKIDIPQEVLDGAMAIGAFILGYFAKDKG
jgi:DNA-binding FrmR family transcriptional regulator